MVAFIAIIASFLTLGQFFIGALLKPELMVPANNRSILIYVILTASNLFWTLYGLSSGIILIAACFGVMLLFNSVVLFISLFVRPKILKKQAKVPYFPQPNFMKNEKAPSRGV